MLRETATVAGSRCAGSVRPKSYETLCWRLRSTASSGTISAATWSGKSATDHLRNSHCPTAPAPDQGIGCRWTRQPPSTIQRRDYAGIRFPQRHPSASRRPGSSPSTTQPTSSYVEPRGAAARFGDVIAAARGVPSHHLPATTACILVCLGTDPPDGRMRTSITTTTSHVDVQPHRRRTIQSGKNDGTRKEPLGGSCALSYDYELY